MATLAVCGGNASSAEAAPPSLAFACSPAPADCRGWYRSPVDLSWDWNQITAEPSAGDCDPALFTSDTRGTEALCEVRNKGTGERTAHSVVLHIDRTAPSVRPVLDRPPDHAGWFNHPVRVSFSGSDATSGVASCSSATYSGPARAAAPIGGSCRDVAGNVRAVSTAINYDATPPAPPAADARPGNERIAVSWSASAGARAEVVRFRGDTAVGMVYQGPGTGFIDRPLRNGLRYRYLVTLIDQAGNRASADAWATPTASKLLSPARGARVRSAPLLEWKKGKRIRYWNVQLYRDGGKVLSSWPRVNELQLQERWRFGGRRYRLVPGRYCWHLWPGLGKRSRNEYGPKLGESCFRVLRQVR